MNALSATLTRAAPKVASSFHRIEILACLGFLVVLNLQAAEAGTNRELFDSLASHWRRCSTSRKAQQENN